MQTLQWYVGEAEKRGHAYLLRSTPARPPQLIDLVERLLAQPGKACADEFAQCVLNFTAWETPPDGWPARFTQDVEWARREDRAPLAEM